MAKSPKSRKSPAQRSAALGNPAVRMTAIRVGVAAAVIGAGAVLLALNERRGDVASRAERPAAVAAAPAKPGPLAALTLPAPAPEPTPAPAPSAPEPPRREAAVEAKPMSAALRSAFDSWLMSAYAKCWKAPKTLPDGDPYLAKVRVAFTQDGELASPPKLVNPPSDPAWKPHAEAALKAVKGCDPLHVPDKYAEYYPSWKSRTVYFDPTRN